MILRRSRSIWALVLLLAAVFPSKADSQVARSVETGDRVRVRTALAPTRWVTGTITSRAEDELVLTLNGAETRRVTWSSITELEVSGGRQSRWLLGTAIGLGLGTAVAVGFLASVCDDDGIPTQCNEAEVLLGFALPPAAVGALLGHLGGGERWLPVGAGMARIGWASSGWRLVVTIRS